VYPEIVSADVNNKCLRGYELPRVCQTNAHITASVRSFVKCSVSTNLAVWTSCSSIQYLKRHTQSHTYFCNKKALPLHWGSPVRGVPGREMYGKLDRPRRPSPLTSQFIGRHTSGLLHRCYVMSTDYQSPRCHPPRSFAKSLNIDWTSPVIPKLPTLRCAMIR